MKITNMYVVIGISIIIVGLATLFIFSINNEDKLIVKENPISKSVDKELDDLDDEKESLTWLPPTENLSVEFDNLHSTFIAPSFMNEEILAFEMSISGEDTAIIGTVLRENESVEFIYETEKGKITNSLVGVDNQLFWVEHKIERDDDTPWEIKSLDLTTNNVQIIASGIGEDQIDPPVLRVYDNQITWIEKEIQGSVVFSYLIAYEPKRDIKTTVHTTTLDEADEWDGEFLLIQRPIKDGLLVEQSVFRPGREKKFELIFYPYDGSEPTVLIEHEGISDFNGDKNWFVWTEDGKVHIINRDTNEEVFTIEDKEYEMSFDSPFIYDDTLFYRYSSDRIFSFNLKTGDKQEVSDFKSNPTAIYSKLFNSKDYLGFSFMEAIEPEDEAQFTIMNISKKDK